MRGSLTAYVRQGEDEWCDVGGDSDGTNGKGHSRGEIRAGQVIADAE
jgi:hypothetical protein